MSYPLPHCEQDGCPGHLGKFDNCVTEAIYITGLDGMDDWTGNVDFDGTFTLSIFEAPHVVTLDEGHTDERAVTIPVGNYITHSASSGAVTVYRYDTEEEAREAYQRADDAYAAWSDEEEVA